MAEKTKAQINNEKALVTAVTEGYLETGEPLTAKDIAGRLDWSESKVYSVLKNSGGYPEGVMVQDDRRASMSSSYKFHQVNSHKVYIYRPTLDTLRALVLQLRANAPAKP